jgi:ATP-dependent Clp protease ATP-binding subunit ClpC
MSQKFTDGTRRAVAKADDEARSFHHDYIGTEHLLLGILAEESGMASDVLKSTGVEVAAVRGEIEKLVERGAANAGPRKLPLTPRAQAAIDYAGDEARTFRETTVGTEHLLLGLLREPDGVAGQVLRNLGIKPDEIRAEVFRARVRLMKIVERAVRPVRASVGRKRKMREELLAHLTAIYDEELERLKNPAAAADEAAKRFGEPLELAHEIELALPLHERLNYFVERWALYRAPESAAHFSMRMGVYTFYLLAVILSTVAAAIYLRYGWIEEVQTLVRVFTAIVLLTPPAQFAVWLSYIKMRDAMWGAFGSRRSLVRVVMFNLLIAIVAQLYLLGVAAGSQLDLGAVMKAGVVGAITAIVFFLIARLSGPTEIRDTHWALLDLESA